jgi:hypothetical protein
MDESLEQWRAVDDCLGARPARISGARPARLSGARRVPEVGPLARVRG